MTARRRRDDSGFTMIELIIATIIVGLVVPPLAAALVVFFRTAFTASVRTDRAQDANLLAAYLQPDLASVNDDPTDGTDPTAATVNGGCANGLTLVWQERRPLPNGTTSAPVTYRARYVVAAAPDISGPFAMRRYLEIDGVAQAVAPQVVHKMETACAATFTKSASTVSVTVVPGDEDGRTENEPLTVSGVIGGRS